MPRWYQPQSGDDQLMIDMGTVLAKNKAIAQSSEQLKANLPRERADYALQLARPLHDMSEVRKDSLLAMSKSQDPEGHKLNSPGEAMLVAEFWGVDTPCSTTPLSELTRVDLAEIQVGKVYKGRYLLVVFIAAPILKASIFFPSQSVCGRYIALGASHLTPSHSPVPNAVLKELFPIGTIYAVREPHYRIWPGGGHTMFNIHCDSPTDLVRLQPDDILLRGTSWYNPSYASEAGLDKRDFRSEGNAYYRDKSYLLAEMRYGEGIRESTSISTLALLYLNRAAVNITLERYNSAFEDSVITLQLLDSIGTKSYPGIDRDTKSKALFRRSLALERMERLDEAEVSYEETVRWTGQTTGTSVEGLARCRKKVQHTEGGKFSMDALFYEARTPQRDPRLDVGRYQGSIILSDLPNRGGGRGMIATRDIKAGELLLAEKAYAVVYPGGDTVRLGMDFKRGEVYTTPKVKLVSAVVRNLLDRPLLARQLYSLYAGPSHVVLDPLGTEKVSGDINVGRIEEIITYNSFTLAPSLIEKDDTFQVLETFVEQPEGLFLTASFFNHSCCGNASWSSINDTIFVCARTDIKAGEEVLIPYCEVGSKLRAQTLKRKLDSGRCDCEMCVMDKLEGKMNVQRCLELVKTQRKIDSRSYDSPPSASAVKRTQQIVKDLEATYAPTRGIFRPAMRHSWLSLNKFPPPITPSPLELLMEGDEYLFSAIRCIGGVTTWQGQELFVSCVPFCYVKEMIQHVAEYSLLSIHARPWMTVAMEMDRLHTGSPARADPGIFRLRYNLP